MRGAEPFVEVSWDRALDLVAGELERVRAEYGNEAIYGSSGWGSAGGFHDARGQLSRFLNLNGGFVDQVTNYSFGAASVIVPRIVGSMSPVVGPVNSWPVIVEHTDLMVAFGGMPPKNQNVNQGGLGVHEGADWHRRAVEAGTEFVCVGPIRDDAGEQIAAVWHSIRPNTDLAVMLGLAHTLLAEGLHDAGFLARCCTGFDRLAAYLLGKSDGIAKDAEWASGISEMPAESIRRLARRMASSRTLIAVSWSVQRADHGEQPYWMTVALAAMLGQIGLPGGGFGFGYGAMHGIGAATRQVAPPKIPIGRNAVDRWIPVARLADMLLNPGAPYSFNGEDRTYPDIRLIYWCGGNPFHKQQDLNNLLKGWAKPETIIIHEPWWTPAAKRADIVLPCTTTLERNDIAASNFDRFVIANQRAIDPGRRGAQRIRHLHRSRGTAGLRRGVYRGAGRDGLAAPSLRRLPPARREGRDRDAGLRRLLGGRPFRASAARDPADPLRRFPRGPGGRGAQDPVGQDRDLFRDHRRVRLRRRAGPSHLDGAGRMARRRQGGAVPAPHGLEPAAGAAPQPARLRFGEPGRQGGGARGDADEPGRRGRARHCRRRRRPRVQRPRRLPRGRRRQRRDPARRDRAGDRRVVRSGRSGDPGEPGEARKSQRADRRQADLHAHPVLRGPDRAGRGRAVRGTPPEITAFQPPDFVDT